MWWQFIGGMLLAGLVLTALKIALILIILAGLIFRTQETVTILLILAVISHPLIGGGIVLTVILLAKYLDNRAKRKAETLALPSPYD